MGAITTEAAGPMSPTPSPAAKTLLMSLSEFMLRAKSVAARLLMKSRRFLRRPTSEAIIHKYRQLRHLVDQATSILPPSSIPPTPVANTPPIEASKRQRTVMRKLSHSKQRLLDQFSRELDKVETRAPMKGGYARIDPYIIDRWEGGRNFEFICYHVESRNWFDSELSDQGMLLMHRHKYVREGDVVFDIGSNSGYMSVWYGLMVGSTGKVLAFDPYPWNALATNFNARLNYLDNVKGYEVGLSDSSFELALPLDAARTIDGFSTNSIRARVADVREYAYEKPTFLKIDIEGGEYELSRADLQALPHVDRIFLELHPFFIEDRGLETKAVLRNYARQGFELHYAHPLHKAVDVETHPAAPGMWFMERSRPGG